MGWTRNNLNRAMSPYLRQHADNPIWWQEWSQEVLDYARKENKLIFVSVGYSTCHWCHVMASESFQDPEVALFLNNHFVSIKVDREQRPDIDQYLMAFIASTGRHGGWPLNCFLTPDLKPFFALTYVPIKARYGMPGFLAILKEVQNQYSRFSGQVQPFSLQADQAGTAGDPDFVSGLRDAFDDVFGGFGGGPKFPSHSTLLFMLYYYAYSKDEDLKAMLEKTLDRMLRGGLHDHLQGGFFRYCVDRAWTIPHFEKMLYDQGMLMWVYSLAYQVLRKDAYRRAVEKSFQCLQETFAEEGQGLYYSAHDADSGHEEGSAYLWSQEELARVLLPEEYNQFKEVYRVSQEGNFSGLNHLVRDRDSSLDRIEKKLLSVRRKRRQPFVDRKIITSWNCLAGVGLLHAYRHVGVPGALERAEALAQGLLRRHYVDGVLAHSSFEGVAPKQAFLQDHAALLLLLTYLNEDTGRFGPEMEEFSRKIRVFWQMRGWIEAFSDDFFPIFAESFDHPVPSSISLAEFALLRAEILLGREYSPLPYRNPLDNDFYNVAGMLANGLFHIVEAPGMIPWNRLPVNSLQKKGGAEVRDCFNGMCRELVIARKAPFSR